MKILQYFSCLLLPYGEFSYCFGRLIELVFKGDIVSSVNMSETRQTLLLNWELLHFKFVFFILSVYVHLIKCSGTCLIQHTKEPGKYVRLYRMSEYSGFILVNRNTLGPSIFVGCHRRLENSGVRLHKFHCTCRFHTATTGHISK
jgi:hypothetical protein